jgi:anti-sigma B factor antagonist/stage II sporulation protein AA (anti-sigma F factor antagonist)
LENIEKIYVDDILVLAVNLTRAILNEAIPFRKLVEAEINSGHTKLVIDLNDCDYIDSTFFGVIVKVSRMLIDIGYKLKVVKPAIVGEYIFIHTNTHGLFDKYNTREDAIRSFEEDIQPES